MLGFGLLAFALSLVFRGYQTLGTMDTDAMRFAEPRTDEPADAKSEAEP